MLWKNPEAFLWQSHKCSSDKWQHKRTIQKTAGSKQECLLSCAFFNSFLESILSAALKEHDGKDIIGSRTITKLQFAGDIDAFAEEEQELVELVESLDKSAQNGNKCWED